MEPSQAFLIDRFEGLGHTVRTQLHGEFSRQEVYHR